MAASDRAATEGATGRIRLLPEHVANQIAAGEVVERPASVVKELAENALDAGARRVLVEVEQAGRGLIRVQDDGFGIAPEDAELAFARHATSKLRTAEELATVASLGFRGEALASIASVARVELASRWAQGAPDEPGVVVQVEAGRPIRIERAGMPPGTVIAVRDLFFNTPARARFLKSDTGERRAIIDVVGRLALAHPEVAFRLRMEGREVLSTPGDGRLVAAVVAVWGAEVAAALLPVEGSGRRVALSGLVGQPGLDRPDRRQQVFCVDGRPIESRQLAAAVEKAYESLLGPRRFPVALLHLRMDPGSVDVNVHPAKAHVRFRDEQDVFVATLRAVRASLSAGGAAVSLRGGPSGGRLGQAALTTPLPVRGSEATPGRPLTGGAPAAPPAAEVAAGAAGAAEVEGPTRLFAAESRPEWDAESPPGVEGPEAWASRAGVDEPVALRRLLSEMVLLGQLHNTYLVGAAPGGLVMIDQHVAHERVLYEQLLLQAGAESREPGGSRSGDRFRTGSRTGSSAGSTAGPGARAAGDGQWVQPLLMPVTVELDAADREVILGAAEELRELGLEVEGFGGSGALLVRAVPLPAAQPLAKERLPAMLRELASRLAERPEGSRETPSVGLSHRALRILATIACHGAVRAGEPLAPERQRHLVAQLAQVRNPFACPHGRPVVVEVPIGEIERRFGRR